MNFRIKGLDKLQRTLEQAEEAFRALDGTIAELSFNPHDANSVENAIAEMELVIDRKLAPHRGNELVEQTARKFKSSYRDKILKRAATARLEGKSNTMRNNNSYQMLFQKIENTVMDLQRAQYNTFDKHIKKLSSLLNNELLEGSNQELIEGIDLEAWINASNKSRGGMVGSAQLSWPNSEVKELGTVILLINRFAQDFNQAFNFSHEFYYNGNNVSSNLQNMVAEMIVPFVRDYISYITNHVDMGIPVNNAKSASADLPKIGFEELLHPEIERVSMPHYHDGDYRHAVLDSVTAIFDKIRQLTGEDMDGAKLVTKVLAPSGSPSLIVATLDTESGRNEQAGVMDMLKGLYQGVRNPKAHSLLSDLNEMTAAQYLVTASLLMRRISEATLVEPVEVED